MKQGAHRNLSPGATTLVGRDINGDPSTDSPILGHSDKQRYKGPQTIQEGKPFIKSSSVGTNKELSKVSGCKINIQNLLHFYIPITNC